MMRRINLLPASYALRAKEKRTRALVIAGGVALLLGMVAWRFMLVGQVASAQSDLEAAQSRQLVLAQAVLHLSPLIQPMLVVASCPKR